MTSVFKKTLSVLVVENNPIDSKILADMLSRSDYGSFVSKTTDSLKEAFAILNEKACDVVLLDLNVKDSKGLETLYEMNRHYPTLPIVVNTGAYQDDLGLKAVTSGAQDYLIKGKYKPYVLHKALYYAIERKRFEQELQTAYQCLKEAQSQLIQAEKMNVIGGVASGIAHEVKNPLATIIYGIEYLNTKITERDEKIDLTLRSIKEAAERANNIIKDLLDFASLSHVQHQREDLNAVIDQGLTFVKYQCENQEVQIFKDYDLQLPLILMDKNRIEQVVVDVMLNSIFMIKGGGQIKIKTYQKVLGPQDFGASKPDEKLFPFGQEVVILDIEDTGPGVPEEHLSKIFDPFFTTRRAEGGVGLGLSIARTIMSSHNGFVELMNIPGGARARIIFPIPK